MGWNHHLAIDMRWWLYSSSRNQPVKTHWKSMSRRWEAILFGWTFLQMANWLLVSGRVCFPPKKWHRSSCRKAGKWQVPIGYKNCTFHRIIKEFFVHEFFDKEREANRGGLFKKSYTLENSHFEANNGGLVQMSFHFNFLGDFSVPAVNFPGCNFLHIWRMQIANVPMVHV